MIGPVRRPPQPARQSRAGRTHPPSTHELAATRFLSVSETGAQRVNACLPMWRTRGIRIRLPIRSSIELDTAVRAMDQLTTDEDRRCQLLGLGAHYAACHFLPDLPTPAHSSIVGPELIAVTTAIHTPGKTAPRRAGVARIGGGWHEPGPRLQRRGMAGLVVPRQLAAAPVARPGHASRRDPPLPARQRGSAGDDSAH